MANSNLFELRKFVAPEYILGNGALELAGVYVNNLGAAKAMIVTDPGIVEAGWTSKLENSLKKAGVDYIIYDGVTPNPKDFEVMTGVERFQKEKCDILVAIGGGSPMDCAKGIGIVSSNGRHILEFEGVDEVPIPGPPLICVPTTAGTSADVSQFAIITDTKRKVKIAIISKTVVPDISLIDADTTTTMSDDLTAATGMDALAHAFESYVSNASSPVTDLNALKAIEIITGNLRQVLKQPDNMEYRAKMMLGSLLAGLAFSNASLGIVHSMAHCLGGYLDLAHGECNAILLKHAVDYNFSAAVGRYHDIARIIGVSGPEDNPDNVKQSLLDYLTDLAAEVGIDQTLSDLGVTKEVIPQLARDAINDPCTATNPVQPTAEDIEKVYEQAL